MIDLVSRTEWGAAAPTGAYTLLARTRGVKVHYMGGAVPAGIVDDHDVCVRLVRDVQRMHMSGGRETKYIDIGYSLAVCPHRKVFVGRGPGRLPAANGAGLNAGHYAVLALLGTSGYRQPTAGLLHGLRDAIEYLRERGRAGVEVKGHRDGFPTACPGGPLYDWVKAGAPRPNGAAPPSDEEDLVAKLPTLKPGAKGWDVKTLRALLFARGFDTGDLWSVEYDEALQRTVRRFQTAEGLDDDAIVGPKTWARLLRV